MSLLDLLFSPPTGLTLAEILALAAILGLLHGITPDEHTWPITFSYAIGSYSTRGGMRSGFVFSAGFTSQRAILTTLGYLGLATFLLADHLEGLIYVVVGIVMFLAGSYILRGRYLHLPIDRLLGGRAHHSVRAERQPGDEDRPRPVAPRMALVHGFIAGWGIGGYAAILVFVLAPSVGSILLAPLVGVAFGLGTMAMQVILGGVFANLIRRGRMTADQVRFIGQKTAGRTLYFGGGAFVAIGAALAAFPALESAGIATGSPIPNLDFIGVAFVLIVLVVGVIGGGSLVTAYRESRRFGRAAPTEPPA